MSQITTLFTDIGGVLLTNGWDGKARKKAADHFNLDIDDFEERHHLTFDTYEAGKLSITEYLQRVIFYNNRPFSEQEFINFMFTQSQPFPDMIELMKALRRKYNLKMAVISNEGRELIEYRIKTYKLYEFVDFFIASCFVHFRKPDADIFKIALDIAQVPANNVIYIEDRPMFVQVAMDTGIKAIHHISFNNTVEQLAILGLQYNIEEELIELNRTRT
jgi:putative hydrolase of the HAD superfamily